MTKTAKTYGQALYELARDENCAGEILEQIETVAQLLGENPTYVRITSSPSLTKEERRDILDQAFRGKIHEYLLNFLKLLSEKGAVGELPGCAREFRDLYNEENGILEVKCVSAVALTEDQRQRLTQRLNATTGKTIRLLEQVDPACLGGLRIEAAGKTLDGTVAGRIGRFRSTLKDLTI